MAINLPPKMQCGVGTACHGCGRRLPLHMTDRDEEALLWECVHCHTAFAGAISPEVLRMLARRIRLAAHQRLIAAHVRVTPGESRPVSAADARRAVGVIRRDTRPFGLGCTKPKNDNIL